MTITLLIGGARSGKSSSAVARALDWQRDGSGGSLQNEGSQHCGTLELASRQVVFVATGSAGDEEMTDRITRHQAERPQSWATVEAPVDLVSGLRVASGIPTRDSEPALIVDCLSMWVANHLMAPFAAFSEDQLSTIEPTYSPDIEAINWDEAETELLRQVGECFGFLATRSAPTWFVSNEVGLSLVPMSAMGRRYRDVLGRVNAKVSLLADEAFLTVAGRVLRLERP